MVDRQLRTAGREGEGYVASLRMRLRTGLLARERLWVAASFGSSAA